MTFSDKLPVRVILPMLYFSSPDAVDEVLSRVMTKLVLSVPLSSPSSTKSSVALTMAVALWLQLSGPKTSLSGEA